MEIDDELATYLQPGPFSIIVATCDENLVPEAVRAWGPKVLEDRQTIELLVGRAPARRLVENLSKSSAMSVSIANVTTYQTLQLKGLCVGIDEPESEDSSRIRVHNDAFVASLALVGVSPEAGRGTTVSDAIRLRFVPEALFDQTPGPGAGIQR